MSLSKADIRVRYFSGSKVPQFPVRDQCGEGRLSRFRAKVSGSASG